MKPKPNKVQIHNENLLLTNIKISKIITFFSLDFPKTGLTSFYNLFKRSNGQIELYQGFEKGQIYWI